MRFHSRHPYLVYGILQLIASLEVSIFGRDLFRGLYFCPPRRFCHDDHAFFFRKDAHGAAERFFPEKNSLHAVLEAVYIYIYVSMLHQSVQLPQQSISTELNFLTLQVVHLGHILTSNLDDTADIMRSVKEKSKLSLLYIPFC